MNLVRVVWRDAMDVNAWDDKVKHIDRAKLMDNECCTVGMLAGETDDRLIICRSIAIEADLIEGLMVIPKSSVKEIHNLSPDSTRTFNDGRPSS